MNERISYYSDFLNDNFKEKEKIGEGGSGKIYKAANKLDGKLYAIRVIKDFEAKPQEMKDNYMKQVMVLVGLQHRNILR